MTLSLVCQPTATRRPNARPRSRYATPADLVSRPDVDEFSAKRLLSVLVPVYNEEEYVGVSLERLLNAPLPEGVELEVVVVDDGSTDGSADAVERMLPQYPQVRLLRHAVNQGKGAAIRTAIQHARGEFTSIQDADLEYDPTGSVEDRPAADRWQSGRGLRIALSKRAASGACSISGMRWPTGC